MRAAALAKSTIETPKLLHQNTAERVEVRLILLTLAFDHLLSLSAVSSSVESLNSRRDVSKSKAHEALRQCEAELVRYNRIMLLGEMAASIAHEVNQPSAGIVANASTGLHWLAAQPPNVQETCDALDQIATDGHRASNIIERIRGLAKKKLPRRSQFDLNEAVRDVVAVSHGDLKRHEVTLTDTVVS